MKKLCVFLVMTILLCSCKNELLAQSESESSISSEESISENLSIIELSAKAHGKEAFLSQAAVKFYIDLDFGGKPRLDATMYMTTDSKYVRIDKEDGTTIFWDGTDIWFNGNNQKDQEARFDALTWSYFFALPFKTEDSGTQTTLIKETDAFDVVELTFGENVGDSPEDWYHLYINKEHQLLSNAGYIVTFGGVERKEAAKNAHAISYKKYKTIDGATLATYWSFHDYFYEEPTTDMIGEAFISNITFGTFDDVFSIPAGSHKIPID